MNDDFIFSPFQNGYGNLVQDCPACECHVNGSVSSACDKVSGQCECKLGSQGLKCDQCAEEFFGLSEEHPGSCEGKRTPCIGKQLFVCALY